MRCFRPDQPTKSHRSSLPISYLHQSRGGHRSHGHCCFFDDPVHQVFGFSDLEFQSLYHFTVGGPVEDSRLTTLAPYGVHVEARERGADLP